MKDLQPAVMRPHFEACETVARVEYAHHRAPEISRRLQSGAEVHGWHAGKPPAVHVLAGRGSSLFRTARWQAIHVRHVRAALPPGRWAAPVLHPRPTPAPGGSFWIAETEQRGADGGRHRSEVRADRIVVACGAVQTPALLRRSGMTRNIGNTLRFHPMVKVVADFGEMVNRAGDYDPVHQIREFEPQIGMGCSISTPAQLGMALAGQKDAWSLVREHWQNMGLYYVQSSGGSARVRNVRGFVDPMVRVRFEEDDLALLAVNLARLATALFAAGARRIYPCIPGYPVLETRADIASLPDKLRPADGSLTSVHVFSSCPMGEDERVCAVNSFGAMFGTEGLYINDASLLCTPTGVNPQGTVMAVARRNAIAMLERRSR
ncbi:GMC oxidoreductase [Novosphingobium panipatense]